VLQAATFVVSSLTEIELLSWEPRRCHQEGKARVRVCTNTSKVTE